MRKLGAGSVIVGLSFATLFAGGGCAQGSAFSGDATGGNGGAGNGAAGPGGEGHGGAGAADPGSGGNGGQGASAAGGAGAGGVGAGGEGVGAGGSGGNTGTTSMPGCSANQHECAGLCVGNTTASGCLQSVSCTPCPVPAQSVSTCTAAGVCDFTCNAGYSKQGSSCVCANECCSNADCAAGETCSGGVCQGGGGTCVQEDCLAECFVMCFPGFGVGVCAGNLCACTCM